MPYNLTTMQSIYHNQDEIVEITYNSSSVYQKSSGPDYTEPFYVENISDVEEELSIKKSNSSAPSLTIEYSTDKVTWNTFGTTSTTALTRTLVPGDKVYLRCSTNAWCNSNYHNAITGVSKVGGNIMSLLYGDNFADKTSFPSESTRNFTFLFYNNTNFVDASKLLLPATTLITYCYASMFRNCTSLTQTPALPATTLASDCYASMFYGCTALTSAPALPATTLSTYCYLNMFRGCTSLTTAPDLPATTLADKCYQQMFSGCTALITAPSLPATTLTVDCYDAMFQGCTSLTTAPSLPATVLTSNCYNSMFSGCTSLITAPSLPATTLAGYCYYNMFYGCTSLTQAPALPATTLVQSCYDSMFSDCTSLNNVTCLATSGINVNNSTFFWLYNVASTGTFTKAEGVTWPTGNNGIPSGWTVLEQ